MQILNNPAQVVFLKSPHNSHHTHQGAQSRPSSIHHPNVIFDSNTHQNQQTRHHHQQAIHIPKKVSFHYSNNSQQQIHKRAPSNQTNNIMVHQQYRKNRKISDYSKSSNQIHTPSIRYRINSTDQKSNAPKESDPHALTSSAIHPHSLNAYQLNYPPTIFKKDKTKIQINHDFPRQRSHSSISSKSSTKFIVETVRQINADGTKGNPIEIKHKIQTEYLTNLNNNNRQNYIMNSQSLPKHIIVNHNYHSPQEVRKFYSPQNTLESQVLRANQNLTGNLMANHQHTFHQSNQSTGQKVKYSEVFSYPVRGSDHEHFPGNKINSGHYESANEHFRAFPITSQSKFEDRPINNHQMNNERFQQTKKNSDQNQHLSSISQNHFTNYFNLHTVQKPYRGYGAEITKQTTAIQGLIERPFYKQRKNKNYLITSEFYSISQQLIDQIFRNQTQRALLKLKSIQRSSPRKYFSPQLRTYRHNRSTEKKTIYKMENRQIKTNFKPPLQNQNINLTSEETVKV